MKSATHTTTEAPKPTHRAEYPDWGVAMQRKFTISANVAPGMPKPPKKEVSGTFSFGAFNAACHYAREHLPGYNVIPGGVQISIAQWRFEAVNNDANLGAVLFLSEIL